MPVFVIIPVLLYTFPSITAMSYQNVQYGLMSCSICSFRHCSSLSWQIACCSLCIAMESGMLVVVCKASIFNCIPGISASFLSLCFCLESQSAMNRYVPSLCMILTLYWHILIRIHCSFCNSVATSFLNIATSSLWSVIILNSLAKQQWWNFHSMYSIPSASHSILLYPFWTNYRLLLKNAMDPSKLLSGVSSLRQLVLLLVCRRAAPSQTPDASFSMYSSLV